MFQNKENPKVVKSMTKEKIKSMVDLAINENPLVFRRLAEI